METSKNFPKLKVVRILIWISPLILLTWLVHRNLVLFGPLTLRCDARSCDSRIRGFASREPDKLYGTLRETKEPYRLITWDPVNIDIELYRTFQRAKVRLTYQNSIGEEALRVGVLTKGSRYEYYDLVDRHPQITYLKNRWNALPEGALTLFQKPDPTVRQFTSVQEFMENLPDKSLVRSYRTDLSARTKIPNYRPAFTPSKIVTSLRGSQTMLVYVGPNEPLEVMFGVQDINRYVGADDITFNVWFGDQLITSEVFKDDGETKATGKAGSERPFNLVVPKTSEGIYRIEVTMNIEDAFTRTIESKQRFVMFQNRLYLAGSREYRALGRVDERPAIVYVKGSKLTATTSHANSLQTITVGGKKLVLDKTNKSTTITLDDPERFTPVTVPIQDVKLESPNGYFALTKDSFFEATQPELTAAEQGTELERYRYVIARHRPPIQQNSWLVAEQNISPIPASRTLHFVLLSDPPLNETRRSLKVKSLEVELDGGSSWRGSVKQFLQTIVQKIRTGK